MNLPTIEEMMAILAKAQILSPEQHFRRMVENGLIDKDGNVMPNKGFVTEEEHERNRKSFERMVAENVLMQLEGYTRQFRVRQPDMVKAWDKEHPTPPFGRPIPPKNQVLREDQDPRSVKIWLEKYDEELNKLHNKRKY